jgi:circadian clock protein KaiC
MTVADGLFTLSQHEEQNAVVRKIRVIKMRGQQHLGGAHTFRIDSDGLRIYPRVLPRPSNERHPGTAIDDNPQRIPTGIAQLDNLLNGGLPQGHALLVVGPSGSGKTILATAFLSEGVRLGEKCVVASFEKGASRLRNVPLAHMIQAGDVALVESSSLDLSVEEILGDLIDAIERTGAKRVVIDSLSELGLYLAPEFRSDFRASVFRILSTLATFGITVLITVGMEDRFTDLRFSQSDTSFLADAIIAMRYVETEGHLTKVLSVIKVRGSAHSTDICQYEITDRGIEIDRQPMQYEGILSGHPSAVKFVT